MDSAPELTKSAPSSKGIRAMVYEQHFAFALDMTAHPYWPYEIVFVLDMNEHVRRCRIGKITLKPKEEAMKITPAETNAALVAFYGPNEHLSAANYESMEHALEAAYRVRKARKKAKWEKRSKTVAKAC